MAPGQTEKEEKKKEKDKKNKRKQGELMMDEDYYWSVVP